MVLSVVVNVVTIVVSDSWLVGLDVSEQVVDISVVVSVVVKVVSVSVHLFSEVDEELLSVVSVELVVVVVVDELSSVEEELLS